MKGDSFRRRGEKDYTGVNPGLRKKGKRERPAVRLIVLATKQGPENKGEEGISPASPKKIGGV